ncbi:MAG: DNA adenine methylase [Candidatus Thorarchaeota archaeon]|nr:DNA adenine methylase [Candidatus Thorarchaeota archaeon]
MSSLDAAHVIAQLPCGSRLLDPFCGTGTIIYEAQLRGLRAVGVDNNPLACVIAKGKTEPLDREETLARLEETIAEARALSTTKSMNDAARKYFHNVTADQIMRVLRCSSEFSPFLLATFYGSICLAARACNNWLWTSTSIGRINKPLRKVNFYSVLQRKARKHIDHIIGNPPVTIHKHDTRQIQMILPRSSVDIVYTSPPYFDALDYTGYYTKIVMDILGTDRSSVRDGLIQRYASYKEEMWNALYAIDKVVHDESLIIFVVGDRMVRKKLIRGSDLFSEIAPWANPCIIEREYTKTASGLWDTINTTRRKEQVIIWDLAAGGRK